MPLAAGLLDSRLLKVPFLLSIATFYHIAETPPNPAPDADEQKRFVNGNEGLFTMLTDTTWMALYGKNILAHTMTMGEIYAVVATAFPSLQLPGLYSRVAPIPWAQPSAIRITPTSLVGWGFVCAGALLRLVCYRHLGRHFTFQLAIRKDHQLVTGGPYSVVRHPSYTASYLFYIGLLLCQFGSGSWWRECDMWHTTLGKVVGTAWLTCVTHLALMFARRTAKEDAVLRNEFKEQWVEWSKQTPYRLLPLIY